MADPISTTLMVVGTGLNAYGQHKAGQAANKAGKHNLAMAQREAEMLDYQAGQEVAAGSINSERIARRAKEIMAENRAKAASGGQSTLDGSVVAIEQEAIKNASMDQLLEMYEAEDRARQIKYQGQVTRARGHYDRWQGKVQQKASNLAMVSTIVQGGADWYDKFGGSSSKKTGGGSVSAGGGGATVIMGGG